jgi:hypothetical protein
MHGYYDPKAPKHCKLDRDEFSKVFAGTLSALCGVWSAYIGNQFVRAILATVLSELMDGSNKNLLFPVEPKWNLTELHAACHRVLYGFCMSWAVVLGRQRLLDELRASVQDDGGWEHNADIATMQRDLMLAVDEKEAAEAAAKKGMH